MPTEQDLKILRKCATPDMISYYSDVIKKIYDALNNLQEFNNSTDVYEALFTEDNLYNIECISYAPSIIRNINYDYREQSNDLLLKHLLKSHTMEELEEYIRALMLVELNNVKITDIISDDMLSPDILNIKKHLEGRKLIKLKEFKMQNHTIDNASMKNFKPGPAKLDIKWEQKYHGGTYACTRLHQLDWTSEEVLDKNYIQYIDTLTGYSFIAQIRYLTYPHDANTTNYYGSPYAKYCYEYLTNKYYNLEIKDIDLSNVAFNTMLLSNKYIDSYKFSTYMIEKAIESSFSGPHMDIIEQYKYKINYNLIDKSLLKKIDKKFIIKNSLEETIYPMAPSLFLDEMLESKIMKVREMGIENLPKGDARLRSFINEKTFTLLKKVVLKVPVDCIPFILGNISKLKKDHQEAVKDLLQARMQQEEFMIDYLNRQKDKEKSAS